MLHFGLQLPDDAAPDFRQPELVGELELPEERGRDQRCSVLVLRNRRTESVGLVAVRSSLMRRARLKRRYVDAVDRVDHLVSAAMWPRGCSVHLRRWHPIPALAQGRLAPRGSTQDVDR